MRRSYEAFRLNRMIDVSTEVLIELEAWRRSRGYAQFLLGRESLSCGIDLGSETILVLLHGRCGRTAEVGSLRALSRDPRPG